MQAHIKKNFLRTQGLLRPQIDPANDHFFRKDLDAETYFSQIFESKSKKANNQQGGDKQQLKRR